jgi:hypothetical protein
MLRHETSNGNHGDSYDSVHAFRWADKCHQSTKIRWMVKCRGNAGRLCAKSQMHCVSRQTMRRKAPVVADKFSQTRTAQVDLSVDSQSVDRRLHKNQRFSVFIASHVHQTNSILVSMLEIDWLQDDSRIVRLVFCGFHGCHLCTE